MAPLIGRARELDMFVELLDATVRGDGVVIALSGAAGAGKTRLATEFLALARTRQFLVLSGVACPYQGDLSYAPLLEALRPVVDGREPWRIRALEGLTDLGRLFDGLPLAPPTPLGDPTLERTRLFEAVSRLLQRVSEHQPLVLLVDDVQWADPSSLDLLLYIARGLADRPCMIILTHRTGEPDKGLRRVLGVLRRSVRLVEFETRPLDDDGVAELAGGLLADRPPQPLIDLLKARSGGIPLFVTALVTWLVDGHLLRRSGGTWVLVPGGEGGLPPDVTDLMTERLGRLDPGDRAVLEAVSVCADASTPAVLQRVCADEGDLSARLGRLRSADLLREELINGRMLYRTTHPLLAECAYAGLDELARRRRHAQVAAALEDLQPMDLGRLAHHIGRAAHEIDPAYALAVLTAAAERAVEQRAGDEGIRHADGALVLARDAGREDLATRLLELLAESAILAGRTETAMAAWRDAAGHLVGEGVRRARCLRLLAVAEWDAGSFTAALAHLGDAAAALTESDPVHERMLVLESRMLLLERLQSYDEMAASIGEVQAIAARTGHPLARAVSHLASTREHGGRFGWILADDFQDTLDAVAELGDPVLVTRLQRPWIAAALARGDHVEAIRRAHASRRLARDAGAPELEIVPVLMAGAAAFMAGAWDDATAAIDEALLLGHRTGRTRGVATALVLRGLVLVHRGDVADAAACIAEARAVYGQHDRHILGTADTVDALIAFQRGDLERVPTLIESAGHGTTMPVLTCQVLAETRLACGDAGGARRAADDIAAGGFPYARVVADRIRALADRPGGDDAATSAALGAAVAGFDALALPFDAARCRVEWAEAVSSTDPDAAAAAAGAALAVFDRLGARPAGESARRVLRGLGHRTHSRSQVTGPLSGRELQVARLVAQGLANAEVARQLFISPRTVTSHLDHIYRRLQLGSRAELTRYVREHLAVTHPL